MTNEPADMLDAAAKKLRDLAGAATPGPWEAHVRACQPEATYPHVGWISTPGNRLTVVENAWDGDVLYIAAMSPPVALGFAKILDATAEHVRSHDCEARCEYPDGCEQKQTALDVARAILGSGWAMQRAAADLASIEQGDA